MSRELHNDVVGIIDGEIIRPAVFCKFKFAGGDLRLWSGIGDAILGGETYTGSGDLGTISAIEESEVLKASGANFSLSGVPSSLIATALGEEYSERFCYMYLVFFDANGASIGDPYLLFSGRMDVMSIEENGELCNITLSAENRLIDLERPSERRYTDEDQKHYYPGDEGLSQVTVLNDGRELRWG